MVRRGKLKWYQMTNQVSNQMIYQCDAKLGNPLTTDCAQLEWNQLSPSSDTLVVGPGATTLLHSNTCYLAISAAISLVLTWRRFELRFQRLLTYVCKPLFKLRTGEEPTSRHRNRSMAGKSEDRLPISQGSRHFRLM